MKSLLSYTLVAVGLVLMGSGVGESRSLYDAIYGLDKRSEVQECAVYRNEAVHAIFDRICDMCHEMYSLDNTNFRFQCRSNCFKNSKFQMCLSQFGSAVGGGVGLPPMRRSNRNSYY